MPVTLPRRADSALFAALLIAGLIATFVLKPPLYSDAHALGMHTIALLVPYVAALVYAVATVLRNRFDRTRLGLAIVLFVLLVLPFADLFTSPIVHFEADDSYRYTLYARNMLSEATLWGSDGLLYGRRDFVDQPGYRYYAGEWRFFVENTGALVRPTGSLPNDLAAALAAAAARLPHYLGYAPGQKLTTLAVALFFAPLGSALVLHAIVRARRSQRALFAVIAAVTIAPTLVFGSGSFPRFEYVNLSVILLSFAVIGSREGPRDNAHL